VCLDGCYWPSKRSRSVKTAAEASVQGLATIEPRSRSSAARPLSRRPATGRDCDDREIATAGRRDEEDTPGRRLRQRPATPCAAHERGRAQRAPAGPLSRHRRWSAAQGAPERPRMVFMAAVGTCRPASAASCGPVSVDSTLPKTATPSAPPTWRATHWRLIRSRSRLGGRAHHGVRRRGQKEASPETDKSMPGTKAP